MKIRVGVDGLHADLAKTGIPSVYLSIIATERIFNVNGQPSRQLLDFLCPFDPSMQCTEYGTKSSGHAGHRSKQKRRLKRKSDITAAAANPIGSGAKLESGSPINAPQHLAFYPLPHWWNFILLTTVIVIP